MSPLSYHYDDCNLLLLFDMLHQFHLVRTFSDTKQLKGDLVINFCTERNGLYDLCVIDKDAVTATYAPRPAPAGSSPTMYIIPKDDDEGLAGWAIALIVILVLTIVFCIGYWIAVMCFGVANCCANCCKGRNNNKGKELQNNIYLDGSRGPNHLPPDYERRLAIMPDSRSRDDRSRYSEKPLALTYYGERRSSQASTYCEDPLEEEESFHDSFTINSYKRRPSRDPTMYIPGQEGRPDPDSLSTFRSLGSNGSRRYHSEEPPTKPKREPTMYVDGNAMSEFPPPPMMSDPSMNVGEQRNTVMYEDVYSDEEVYNDYHRGESDGNGGSKKSKKSKKKEQSGKHHDTLRTHDRGLAGKSAISSQKSRSSMTNHSSVYSG